MLKYLYTVILFAGILILNSCKSSYISVDVLEPARIDVPQEIKSLVIANRSLPAKDKRAGNIIEGVFTGEGLFNDRLGSEQCVIGAVDLINNSPRFKSHLAGDMDIRGTGTGRFPEPLEWSFVRQTCNRYNVDAMVTLATFDSDSHIDYHRHEYTREEDGEKIRVVEFGADLDMTISAGWRIYYPDKLAIVDENVYVDRKSWGAKGDTKNEARNNLPSKRAIIEEAGFYAGQQYAARISPVWIKVSRSYFSKGNDQLEHAARYARQGNWDKAAETWETLLNDPDKKIAGQAAYNLALAAEMSGNLEEALKWAEKSYYDYGIKRARNYINIIKGRIADEQRLDKQLKD
jgi:hypothetical protein